MRLVLHVFKKDVRRWWWAILLSLVPLIALTHEDRWRADSLASSSEGWLNLLVPLAWASLIATVVHEEPLLDERHFWIAWPYRWPALLASKALFALTFIQIPSFLSDAAIVTGRGFSVQSCFLQLLSKQAVLACILTVPAMALAALCRNIAHFLLAAISILGVAVYLSGGTEPIRTAWIAPDPLRSAISVAIVFLAAAAIVPIQYARRRTVTPRVIGFLAAATAALLFARLPPVFTTRVRAALHPARADLSLHLTHELISPRPRTAGSGNEAVQIALPIAVAGVPSASTVQFAQTTIEIFGASGQHYRSPDRISINNFEKMGLAVSTFPYLAKPDWLVLRLRRSAYRELQAGTIRIKGVSTVAFHRAGQTTWLAVGENASIPGAGRCSSAVVEGPSLYQDSMLKVLCESPNELSPGTAVRLWNPATGRSWIHRLGDSSPAVSGPRQAWLSPLDRLQTFFISRPNRTRNRRARVGWFHAML